MGKHPVRDFDQDIGIPARQQAGDLLQRLSTFAHHHLPQRSPPRQRHLQEMGAVEQFLRDQNWNLQQVQDFIPLPMTGSAAMYVTGLDINSEQPIPVVRNAGDRERQKRMLRPNAEPRPRSKWEEPLDTVD